MIKNKEAEKQSNKVSCSAGETDDLHMGMNVVAITVTVEVFHAPPTATGCGFQLNSGWHYPLASLVQTAASVIMTMIAWTDSIRM